MGMLPKHLHLLALESKNYKNSTYIHGNALTLGQQAVYATLLEAKRILQSHGVAVKELPAGFDAKNKIPQWHSTELDNNTNTQAVLSLLGADKVEVTDVSSYENPDFVVNLNEPVVDEYKEKFDLVFDIGTLEHIFDSFTALSNIAKMTTVGGRVIFIVPASNAINHGFYSFSPTFFYDFFEANGFSECNIFFLEGNPFDYFRKGKILKFNRTNLEYPLVSNNGVEMYFTAVKEKNVEKITKPIQGIYLQSAYWNGQPALAGVLDRHSKLKVVLKKLLSFLPASFYNWIYIKIKRKGVVTYIGKY